MNRLRVLTLLAAGALAAAAAGAADFKLFRAAPSGAAGPAAVVCPGGSYAMVSDSNEGTPIGEFLAANGITAAVVNYTLPEGRRELPMADVREAFSYLRDNAAELGIAPDRIGVVGSSAGGHLAATFSTAADSLRPAFTVLLYPVISSRADLAHARSFRNLLGEGATAADKGEYSCELRVDRHTPPALLILADDDPTVDPRNSVEYYLALKRFGIPASLHIYPRGGHGFGFTGRFPYLDSAKALIIDWLDGLYKQNE